MNTSTYSNEARYSNDVAPREERRRIRGERGEREFERASRVSSGVFLWAAGGAMVASVALRAIGMQRFLKHGPPRFMPIAQAVGMLTPLFLILGVHRKIDKLSCALRDRD